MAESLFDLDFGTGLAYGAASVFLLLAARWFWVHRLLPMVRRWWYPGVNISGQWNGSGAVCTPAHGEWNEVVLSLQQDLDAVHGVVTLRGRSGGKVIDVRLRAVGQVADGYLGLSLAPAGGASPSPASALLKIGGGTLDGQLLYRHPLMDVVDVIDLSARRAPSGAASQLRPADVAANPVQCMDAGSSPGVTSP